MSTETCSGCGGPLESSTSKVLGCCLACAEASMDQVTVESVGELLEGLLDRDPPITPIMESHQPDGEG